MGHVYKERQEIKRPPSAHLNRCDGRVYILNNGNPNDRTTIGWATSDDYFHPNDNFRKCFPQEWEKAFSKYNDPKSYFLRAGMYGLCLGVGYSSEVYPVLVEAYDGLYAADIMDYSIESLRSRIGYVPQDNFLYSKDIESNIAFSSTNKKIDIEKVKEKARIAGVDQDIMEFPNKYETVLGERGVSVSGGQKQRISIARALYKEPDLLILDDSLSAVDTKTESEILNFLKQERKGKTTILIAHRISSIKDADKIIVLDRGGILSGFDSHQNLLDNNEIYRETYNLQKLEEEGGVLSV